MPPAEHPAPGRLRVSIDTGGTFTDVIVFDDSARSLHAVKVRSTPADPSDALLHGLDRALQLTAADPTELEMMIHGTTTATNALLEHRFEGVGLLVTEGFRHILEIARQSVPDGYGNSFFWVKPPRLVPLHLVAEVPERMTFEGREVRPVDVDATSAAIARLVADGVTRLGICLLHSYANDAHERQVAELASSAYPELFISLSSVVLPEYREYERAMSTLVDVMVKPFCARYLHQSEHRLTELAGPRPFLIMQSNGGVATAAVASERPITMLLSGPAGGVLGAIEAARRAGLQHILTLDAGGTSTDVSLVEDLTPNLRNETRIEGYAVKTPMIDITSVGTGGGSVAWIGPQGAMKVGPRSAGAWPGPVCYGQGGTEPTVTDAALVLGRLPTVLAGGEVALDATAARAAVAAFGARFELSPEETAAGVLELAAAGQVNGIRQVTTLRGRDPAAYTLVAFGGAGPLLACEVSDFLGIATIVVPPNPGNFSAFGLQVTDIKRDLVRTLVCQLRSADSAEIEQGWRSLEQAGGEELRRQGVAADAISLLRGADLRYLGEGHEVTVWLPARADGAAPALAEAAFHREHERVFGFSYEGRQDVELVNLRVQALGTMHRPSVEPWTGGGEQPPERRDVYWRESGWTPCAIHQRAALPAGSQLAGPAIVEEYGSTTVVASGWVATVDGFANLTLKRS